MGGISTSVFGRFGGFKEGSQRYEKRDLTISSIDPHPDNRPIDQAKVKELADTIERDGLGQLPLVRPMPNGRYQMIAGHHRLEAFKLIAERTGDPKWRHIPVNVISECDDDRALCLLHMTNLAVVGLSKAEAGRAYEAIAAVVRKERETNPDRYAGKRTNAVVAEISTAQGKPASETYVKTARREFRASEGLADAARVPRNRLNTPREPDLAADALQRAIERLDSLSPDDLGSVVQRLARYSRRLRSLIRECEK